MAVISNIQNIIKTGVEQDSISVFDTQDSLKLFHFNEKVEESTSRLIRGVVIENDKVVCCSFPHTDDIQESEEEKLIGMFGDEKNIKYCTAVEGTIIRVYFADGEWRISTHKKIDAYCSYWAGKDFGSIFEDCLFYTLDKYVDNKENMVSCFLDSLDNTKCYVFLMCNHIDNKIVCYSFKKKPFLLHLATFEQCEEGLRQCNENCNIPKPQFKITTNGLKELQDIIRDTDPSQSPGVVVMVDGTPVKIINKEYKKLSDLRGNQPSLRFRFLQLLGDDERMKQFLKLYDEKESLFDNTIKRLNTISVYIHKFYIYRYIKHNFLPLPPEIHHVLKRCHEWHLQDKENNKVYLEAVWSKLISMNPVQINRLLKTNIAYYKDIANCISM